MADKFYWHRNLNQCKLLMKIVPSMIVNFIQTSKCLYNILKEIGSFERILRLILNGKIFELELYYKISDKDET